MVLKTMLNCPAIHIFKAQSKNKISMEFFRLLASVVIVLVQEKDLTELGRRIFTFHRRGSRRLPHAGQGGRHWCCRCISCCAIEAGEPGPSQKPQGYPLR
jgi:hypothetical protein